MKICDPAKLLNCLFGSDWPVIMPDRWMSDFAKLEIRDEIRPKVLKANARKLLNM
jgi:predicted TIM-barrel fold metal-dependent hydrolase